MKKNKLKFPIATIVLALLLIVFYFVISGGASYVTPLSKMYPLGVSGYNFLGAFTYTFMHIGIKHLLGNWVAFVVFGVILEQVMDRNHVLALFMASGVLGGVGYALLHPEVWVIGASAAVAGVLVAGFVADPKKTAIAFVTVMFLVPNLILPAADIALDELERQKIIAAAQAKLNIHELDELIASGNYSNETLLQKEEYEQDYLTSLGSRLSLEEGRDTEAATPASFEIHMIGGFVALMFMYFFDKKIMKRFWRKMRGFVQS